MTTNRDAAALTAGVEVLSLAVQSDRKVKPTMSNWRRMTLDEIKALREGQHCFCLLNSGRVGSVKVNGAVRRWKRNPDRVEVSVKYGMYEYARFTTREGTVYLLLKAVP